MPSDDEGWAEKFPNVRFDFAHCPDLPEMARVIADHPNVWTDVAYRLQGWRCESGIASGSARGAAVAGRPPGLGRSATTIGVGG